MLGTGLAIVGAILLLAALILAGAGQSMLGGGAKIDRRFKTSYKDNRLPDPRIIGQGKTALMIAGLLALVGAGTCAVSIPVRRYDAAEEAEREREAAQRAASLEPAPDPKVEAAARAAREKFAAQLAQRLIRERKATGTWVAGPRGTWIGIAIPRCGDTAMWLFLDHEKLSGQLRAAGFKKAVCQAEELHDVDLH